MMLGFIFFEATSISRSSPSTSDTTTIMIADTNNVRVRQWRHYFNNVNHINEKRRSFYYKTVYEMLKSSGFSEQKSRIYAEIPSVESNWNSTAVSSSGAIGLWQIMPRTGEEYDISKEQLMDPYINTQVAIAFLQDMDTLMRGDIAKVLFTYNAGAGVVNSLLVSTRTDDVWMVAFPKQETYHFAPKVLGAYLAMNRK